MGKRLLLLAQNYRWQGTGLEHSAVRTCRGLEERGHEIHVLCDQGEPHDGVKVHHGLGNFESVKSKLAPDLVLDWGFHHAAHVHRMGAGTHEGYLRYYMEAFHGLHRTFKEFEKWLPKHQRVIQRQKLHLRNPEAWYIANSRMTADLAIEGGADPRRVDVCHQHVALDEFKPANAKEHRAAMRASWGVSEDETVFLFVAHNLRLKNYNLLRRVFERGNLGKSKLVVIGKHQPNHAADWLIYAGKTEEMVVAYGAADILVHPTFFDSCANVALEAAGCKLPVIVSTTSGINEILPDEWSLSVQGDRAEIISQWEHEMGQLASNKELREFRGEQGHKIAQKYGYDEYLDWLEQRLDHVALQAQ